MDSSQEFGHTRAPTPWHAQQTLDIRTPVGHRDQRTRNHGNRMQNWHLEIKRLAKLHCRAEKSKAIIGRDRLNWLHANGRLFLFYGSNHCAAVEPDLKYAGIMWRIRFPDGRLSDMLNLSRAKDAAITCALRSLNSVLQETPSEGLYVRKSQ